MPVNFIQRQSALWIFSLLSIWNRLRSITNRQMFNFQRVLNSKLANAMDILLKNFLRSRFYNGVHLTSFKSIAREWIRLHVYNVDFSPIHCKKNHAYDFSHDSLINILNISWVLSLILGHRLMCNFKGSALFDQHWKCCWFVDSSTVIGYQVWMIHKCQLIHYNKKNIFRQNHSDHKLD